MTIICCYGPLFEPPCHKWHLFVRQQPKFLRIAQIAQNMSFAERYTPPHLYGTLSRRCRTKELANEDVMSRRWTEKKIAEMEADGRGRGVGKDYLPWIHVRDFSSRGTSRRAPSAKTGRTHQLLSDVEYDLFLLLEWSRDFTDIREQYPLDRDMTQDVARTLGIRHPCYPSTHIPVVMTVDFLCTRATSGADDLVAFDAKRTEEAEDEHSLLKLEIQRATLELMGIPHHLVYHSDLPAQKVRSIERIRDSQVKEGEAEPRPGYWASMSIRMSQMFASANSALTLAEFCAQFDAANSAQPGTGLRAARLLMWERVLVPDLSLPAIEKAPLSAFLLTGSSGHLRAVGGA